MVNYHFPTVIQQPIPVADVTILERLILGQIFDMTDNGETISLTSWEGACPIITLNAVDLVDALEEPACQDTTAQRQVHEQLGTDRRLFGEKTSIVPTTAGWRCFRTWCEDPACSTI